MIKKEFSNIFHSKSIMFLIVAIVLIPFVYSFSFLTSAWDPYGNTGKVPIAVVNNDVPTTLQGKKVNVGEQTIAKLRKDDQLGWHIVSAKQAAKGLKDNKYYTVVTIPADFSKDAATVLDAHPHQMKLTYKTNGSLNYISEVMSQVGADKLNAQIRANVTNAFASTLFEQVGSIGKQIGTAADGATQISDGTVTLDNGLNQYTVGVSKVHDGIQTMKVSTAPLSSGVQQLTDGSNQLAAGLDQLQGNVPALSSGVNQLYDGSGKIKGGLSDINDQVNGTGDSDLVGGVQQLTDGIGAYTNGTDTVANGISTIYAKHDDLESGVKSLADNMQVLYNNIYKSSTKVVDGRKVTTPAMVDAIQQLADGMNQLKKSTLGDTPTTNLVDAIDTLNNQVNKSISSFNTAYSALGNGTAAASGFMSTMATNVLNMTKLDNKKEPTTLPTLIANGQAKVTAKSEALTDDESAKMSALEAAVDALGDSAEKDKVKTALSALKTSQDTVNKQVTFASGVLDAVNYQMTASGDIEGTPIGLQSGVNMLNSAVTTADAQGNTFTSAINDLTDGLNQLNAAVGNQSDKQYTSTKQQAKDKQTLAGGVSSLTDGAKQLEAAVGVETNTKNPTTVADALKALYQGTQQLKANSGALNDGIGKLNYKAPKLSAGVTQLLSGSGQLNAGLGQLNGKVPTLASGVSQLDTGSHQLSAGLNQLNGKVPALLDGVNQLADGTTQLNDNSGKLTDGTGKLKDGSKQLADGLTDGYKEINKVKLTKATAKMFAEPSNDVQKRMTTVPNYGAALAPYVLALALFIAIIIFNFTYPMRRNDGYKSVAEWLKAKLTIGTLVALAMAVIEATLMLAVGLPVDHIGAFYGITILFALAAMYLTQMLNLAFGGVGIFVALGLLTLSGSGGLFPAETVSPLYESFQKFLPMTYAINGFRNAITSGIASATVAESVFILIAIAVISVALMFPAISYLLGKSTTEE